MATEYTAAGNAYEAAEYVDPFPGRKGDEIIKENCSWCGGTGIYEGPSGYKFYTPAVGANTTGCFRCMGVGHTKRKVSSLRASARRQVKAANQRAAEAADYAAEAPARLAAEIAEAWDAAHAEQARRAAKPKGHAGTIGERFRKVDVEVTMYRTFESYDYVTGAPVLKAVIKFRLRSSGLTLVWFTDTRDVTEGDLKQLSFTVKKHDQRDGEDQTIITRAIIH